MWTEGQIVAGLRRGEGAAFDALYTQYSARVHAFLWRASRRRDVADDLFQETWIKAAGAAPRLREDTRLAAWLFTIARNVHVSWQRWSMLDVSRWVTLADDALAATSPAVTDGADGVSRVERALAALPVDQREALLLVCVEGLDQREAADVLGVGYDGLRQRLARARARLAARLAEMDREEAGDEHA